MKRYVVLEKQIGETPLVAIQEWKAVSPEYAEVPASYAGRLDPMASGKLLILLGEECKKQKAYTGLDKEYEIEVLLDVGSDTGDVLGITSFENKETHPSKDEIQTALALERGTHVRAYPIFSSKTVHGKPLFQYFYEGTISHIEIPTHKEKIYRLQHLGVYETPAGELEKRINELLAKVPRTEEVSKRLGEDFRIDAVRKSWEDVFKDAGERKFKVLRLRVSCASGTYMRSLAPRLGEALHTNALALSIHRTKIGKYLAIAKGLGFWVRTFV